MSDPSLVYVDCETTGTNPAVHELWEVALVTSDPRPSYSQHFKATVNPLHLELADQKALEVGRFFERHHQLPAEPPRAVAARLREWLDGARLASCNVSFDTAFLRRFLNENGQPVTWHYSPIDIKSLCYGLEPSLLGAKTEALLDFFNVPYDADTRHTALDDAKLARDLHEAAVALYRLRAESATVIPTVIQTMQDATRARSA